MNATKLLNEEKKCRLCGLHNSSELDYNHSSNVCDYCYKRQLDKAYEGDEIFIYECKVCGTQYDITEGGNLNKCPSCEKINLERIYVTERV